MPMQTGSRLCSRSRRGLACLRARCSWIVVSLLVLGLAPLGVGASPRCGQQDGDALAWSPMPSDHPAWGSARRFMRALASRDLRRLSAASGLPLVVRYPNRYDKGRIVEYAIDKRAADAAARQRFLAELLTHFPRSPDGDEDSDLAVLGRGSRADVARLRDGALRIRFCPDYDHQGDGTFDQIELTLRQHNGSEWQIHAVEITWLQLL